ncbi:MAG: permease [Patescibacteria group bacterium]
MLQEPHACAQCEKAGQPLRFGRKLKLYSALFVGIFAISFLPFLGKLNESLTDYLKLIWWAILLGFVLGGIIDFFIPEGFIFKYLGRKRKRSLLFAVAAGFLMSACSHGILAIAIQLYKKGANIPAVITFLLASPWANLPVTILLFGFFGWKALLFILAAVVIALITGLIYMALERAQMIEPSRIVPPEMQAYEWNHIKNFKFKTALRGTINGAIKLANMVLWWLIIGTVLAAVIGAYVPEHVFHNYFGPTLFGLVLTLLAATVIEVCSEGSAPIAFELFTKLGVLGNPFVFLMAGVATDYTEIGLLWTNIGKKTALWLPVVAVPQIVAVGILFNAFL